MSSTPPKTPMPTVLYRLARLLLWLARTARRLHRLNHADLAARQRILQQMGAECLHILAAEVRTNHAPPPANGTLLAANHVSWLDIFVLVSLYPCSFIAMRELQSWPLIGRMIRNAGAVFINRSSRKDIDPINTAIAQTLQQNGNICFFPEARTSLGNGVLPLKAALFESALLARAPVQAVALRYYDAQGQRSEAVSFADASLPVSLWRIVRMPRIIIQADFAEPLTAAPDRFTVKTQVENFLRQQVLSDSPAPDRLLPE